MLILTFWEDPKHKSDPDDYDEIFSVRLKTVKTIPEMLARMPKNATMVSTEYSGNHTRNGKITTPDNPRRFKMIWRAGEPIPTPKLKLCPMCGAVHQLGENNAQD